MLVYTATRVCPPTRTWNVVQRHFRELSLMGCLPGRVCSPITAAPLQLCDPSRMQRTAQTKESAPTAVTRSPVEGLIFEVMKLQLMQLAGYVLSNYDLVCLWLLVIRPILCNQTMEATRALLKQEASTSQSVHFICCTF